MTEAFYDGYSRAEYLAGEGDGIANHDLTWQEHAILARDGLQVGIQMMGDPEVDDSQLEMAGARVDYHAHMAMLGHILDGQVARQPAPPVDRRPKRERGARP